MITTTDTKEQQVAQGFYQRGSGPENILLVGSCRTIPYLSYLVRWNETIGNNRFTISRMDPCEWIEVGIQDRLSAMKTDQRILSLLRSCDIFIHEHLQNYGPLNTDVTAEENIYQFGINEGNLDISIPNWNDVMILKEDYTAYGAQTPPDWIQQGELAVLKFIDVCSWSSFPEFGDHFRDTWRKVRYFWRPNHTAATFTMEVFKLMNTKFLHLDFKDQSENFMAEISQWDLFRDPHTSVTQEDVDGYRLEWR